MNVHLEREQKNLQTQWDPGNLGWATAGPKLRAGLSDAPVQCTPVNKTVSIDAVKPEIVKSWTYQPSWRQRVLDQYPRVP